MSAAVVALAVEGALLAVALLFILALLRSHAEILRRLAALEADPSAGVAAHDPAALGPNAPERAPADIAGQNLVGDAVKLSLAPGAPRTLMAFLSSGCVACRPLWAELGEAPAALPPGMRLVVLTKGPERESVSRLSTLSAGRAEVVMSTAAWEAFAVPATPHFALVEGASGAIIGRGSATSWQQIIALLSDADADSGAAVPPARESELRPPRPSSRSSSARALRAEETLASAGITSEHPSLYPSRDRGSGSA